MTLPVQVPENGYIANGSNTIFAFTFRIITSSDIDVFVDSVLQTETVDYLVTDLNPNGGNIEFFVAPASGAIIELKRDIPQDQTTHYDPYDPFPAKTHEFALDKLTMLVQDLSNAIAEGGGGGGGFDPNGDYIINGNWQFTQPVDGVPATTDDQLATFAQATGGGGGFNPASDQTITGDWEFSAGLTFGGAVVATVDDLPDLSNYAQKTAAETIDGAWTFTQPLSGVAAIAPDQFVVAGQLPSLATYTQRTENESITGLWSFTQPVSGPSAVGIGQYVTLGQADGRYVTPSDLSGYTENAGNEVISGNWDFTNPLKVGNAVAGDDAVNLGQANALYPRKAQTETITGDWNFTTELRLDGNIPNTAGGLVQLTAGNKVPSNLLPFTSLTWLGTWDASGGTNPPNATVSGEFYTINVAGTLTIFVDDTGIPVATAVSPGDNLLYSDGTGAYVQGWYYIARESPVFTPATNVTYNNGGTPWGGTTVQAVLNEIGAAAALKAATESITGQWTFTLPIKGPNAVATNDMVPLGQADGRYGRKASAETISAAWNFTGGLNKGGVEVATLSDIPTPPDLSSYAQNAANETITGDWNFTQTLAGIPAVATTEFVTLGQADGRYGRKASAETISGNWNHTGTLTVNGVAVATTAQIPSLTNYTQRNVAEAIAGAWQFNAGAYLANNLALFGRDNPSSAWISLIKSNASNQIEIGASGRSVLINGDALTSVKDLSGQNKTVGYLKPTRQTFTANHTVVQANEGQYLELASNNTAPRTFTLPVLTASTTLRIANRSTHALSIVGSGVTIEWMSGADGLQTGSRVLAPGSVCEVFYIATSTATVFGNGLS